MTGRLTAGALLLALAGCGADEGTACPAIGHSSTLVVELAQGWPDEPGRSVQVECDAPCADPYATLAPASERTAALTGTAAELSWFNGVDAVVVTVLGADDAEQAEVTSDLDWVRVGGTAECGGPLQATVTVPAP